MPLPWMMDDGFEIAGGSHPAMEWNVAWASMPVADVLLRAQGQFTQVMLVEFAVRFGGLVQRERAGDMDMKMGRIRSTADTWRVSLLQKATN